MMKFFAAAFVAIVAVSCVKEMGTENPQSDVKMVKVTFGADLNDATKTIVGVVNDSPAVLWTAGDRVAVYDSLSSTAYEFRLCGGEGTSTGVFTGELPETSLQAEKQAYVIVYPYENYDGYQGYTSENRHQVNMKAMVEQPATAGSFAEETNMSCGLTRNLEEGVVMYNLPSYLKIGLEGTGVTSVTVYDHNNMNCLSGYGRVNIYADMTNRFWNPSSGKYSQNRVTLVPGTGAEIASGTYYLAHRPAAAFSKGMTLKFTNADGRVAYYSTDDAPSSNAGQTIPVGTWNSSVLAWKNVEEFTIDFSSWPFEETVPSTDRMSDTFTLTVNGRAIGVNTSSDFTSNGLLFNTKGDYVEFPAIPGKKLKEVQVYTSGNGLKGTVVDASGNLMGGPEYQLYGGNYYTFIVPKSEINTKYRYQVTTTNASPRILTIKLTYAGDDVAEISGVTASATNAYEGFSVKGELLGAGLDAAAWGIEYGTSEDALAEVATGNGGVIDHFVEAAEGTYYLRVWASADNGTTKTYSAVTSVTVKKFSGTITFDFSSAETVQQNISYVGTTGSSDPLTATDILTNKYAPADGVSDYYTYSTSEGVWPFTITCRNSTINAVSFTFNTSKNGYSGIRFGNNTYTYCMISIPVVENYRLTGLKVYCITNDGRFGVSAGSESYEDGALYYVSGSTAAEAPYEYDVDLSEKEITDETQCWISATKNRIFTKFIFTYEKVN